MFYRKLAIKHEKTLFKPKESPGIYVYTTCDHNSRELRREGKDDLKLIN